MYKGLKNVRYIPVLYFPYIKLINFIMFQILIVSQYSWANKIFVSSTAEKLTTLRRLIHQNLPTQKT